MTTGAERTQVLFLLPTLEPAGTERHVAALAAFLHSSGYGVTVASLYREGALAEEIRRSGVGVSCLGLRGPADPRGAPRLLGRMRGALVLHSYLFGMDLLAALAARLARVPWVLLTRREIATWMRPRHKAFRNAGNLLATHVICCSDAVRRHCLGDENLAPEIVLTIRNGVDSRRFAPDPARREEARKALGLDPGALAVGVVSNFGEEKGHGVLLEAARSVASARPETRIVCVGDGPLRPAMETRAARSGLSRNVAFTGFRPDVELLLQAFDIAVCPSVREGLPNALLEAMASARPVVATRVGGIPEVVVHGRNGLLVPPGDPGALAQSILRLSASPDLRLGLAAEARRTIEQGFTLERSHAEYLRLYEGLGGEKAGGAGASAARLREP